MRCARHCEERSDEAIQEIKDFDILGLLRFARNGGILQICYKNARFFIAQ